MARANPTYEVHLDTTGVSLDVVSPVQTSDVRFYDTGVWVGREGDRVFVPYHRIELIREGVEDGAPENHEGTSETS